MLSTSIKTLNNIGYIYELSAKEIDYCYLSYTLDDPHYTYNKHIDMAITGNNTSTLYTYLNEKTYKQFSLRLIEQVAGINKQSVEAILKLKCQYYKFARQTIDSNVPDPTLLQLTQYSILHTVFTHSNYWFVGLLKNKVFKNQREIWEFLSTGIPYNDNVLTIISLLYTLIIVDGGFEITPKIQVNFTLPLERISIYN